MKKRILSILCAAAMIVSMMAVGTSAAENGVLNVCGTLSFKDSTRIIYDDAVAVTAGLGLFAGTDGKFNPKDTVTRAQMATIIVKMLKGSDFNADSYGGAANPFPDTAAFQGGWAEGYINACAQLGVVKGYGDGTFRPGNKVTVAEALTMIINALKVDAGQGEWPTTVMNKAFQMHLCDTLVNKPDAKNVLSREQLAAIVCEGVQYKPEGGKALIESVFGVKNINDKHVFQGDRCTGCGGIRPVGLTRAHLEEAVVNTAWAYYAKGEKLQYCSQVLNEMGKYYEGKYRVNEDAAPEYGTSDMHVYSVCADWDTKVYLHALNYRIGNGREPLNGTTDGIFFSAENQVSGWYEDGKVDPITEDDVDTCIMRWKDLDYTEFSTSEKYLGVDKSKYYANYGDNHLTFANGLYATTKEEQALADNTAREFLYNWQKNLRPGDVFVSSSHALLYIGGGYVLDCSYDNNGGKYDTDAGLERHERYGALFKLQTTEKVADKYIKSSRDWFVVTRPIDAMVVDDGDSNLANDLVTDPNIAITVPALSRIKYPVMDIDRTVDITPFGTVSAGGEMTYSVKITNKSRDSKYVEYRKYVKHQTAGMASTTAVDYKALPVSEVIPAGTEFVRATGDYKMENNKLSWTVDVPAGKTVEVTYTVKVTAPIGSTITNDGGFVADIPSNSIVNTVGGKKLNEQALSVLENIADTHPGLWNETFNLASEDLDFAEKIYAKMGIHLELPTIAQMMNDVFSWTVAARSSGDFRYTRVDGLNVFMLKDDVTGGYKTARDMLVENYWGGYRFFTGADKKGTDINEMRVDYLEPGDILVYADTDEKTGVSKTSNILVYAGQNSKGEHTLLSRSSKGESEVFAGTEADARLWNAFMGSIDLFFVLRPTQGVNDINALKPQG